MEKRPNILVIRLSALGDVIRTLPAVKAIKRHYPSSNLVWIVEEPSRSLIESQPEVDEVIVFPRSRWEKGIRSFRGLIRTLLEIGCFIRHLRGYRFDMSFDFHGLLKSGLISFLSGAPKRFGFHRGISKEWSFLFSNIRIRLPAKRMNRYQQNLALLKGIGLDIKDLEPELAIPSEDREYVDSFFETNGFFIRRPLVAVHPGTSPKTRYKRWMHDRYARVADRLIKELDASILFTWGPGELDWVERVRKEMKEASILGPETRSLTQLAELFRRCDLFIGGDTGPMHIASMMGVPVVAIFGPTYPEVNAPWGAYRMVRKDVGCNPCRNRSCRRLFCLEAVTPEDVLEAVREMLASPLRIGNLGTLEEQYKQGRRAGVPG